MGVRRRLASALAVVSMHCALCPAVRADAAENTESAGAAQDQLAEIVVTAQKRAEPINSVGLTIQAATSDTLDRLGINSVGDLSKLVSGLTATTSLYSTPVYTLRGIGLNESTFAASPSVAVYSDESPRNFPVMSSALDLDLERVEVLKGPQGTLFGQSSTGGAINYIVAKPTSTPEGGLDVDYQRFGRISVEGFVSGPVTDTVKMRLAARAIEGGAWQYSVSRPGDDNGATRKIEGRWITQWQPIERLTNELQLTAASDQSDVQAPQYVLTRYNFYSAAALAAADANPATRNPYGIVNPAAYAAFTTPGSAGYDASFLEHQATLVGWLNGTDPVNAFYGQSVLGTPRPTNARAAEWTQGLLVPMANRYTQAVLRNDYKLTDSIVLTNLSTLAQQRLDYNIDQDATPAPALDVGNTGSIHTFNEEIRLSGTTDRFKWILGGDYDNLTSRSLIANNSSGFSGAEVIPGLHTGLSQNDLVTRQKTFAGFANGEYAFTDQLTAQAGVRYTHDTIDATFCYSDPVYDTSQAAAKTFEILQSLFTGGTVNTPILPGQCYSLGDGKNGTTYGVAPLKPLPLSLSEHNVSWRTGLSYKLDQGTLLYATVSQGYKAGIFSQIAAATVSQYSPAKQEKLVSYEGGFKAPLLDHHVQLNGAVFYYDYTDKQVRARVSDPVYGLLEKLVNVPKSYVEGVEADIAARPIEGLEISGGGAYLRAKVSSRFDHNFDGAAVYNAQGYTGNFEDSTLPYTPKFTGNINVDYSWEMNGMSPFVGGSVVYQGSQNATFQTGSLIGDEFDIPSYTTVDLRAGFESADGAWRVTFYGRNVLNKYYITSRSLNLDELFQMAGMPAVYGISVKRLFQ